MTKMRLSIGSEDEAYTIPASLPGSISSSSSSSLTQSQILVHAIAVEKSNIVNLFKLTLKRLLDSMNTLGRRMLTIRHEPLQQFLLVIERVLQHGLLAGKSGFSITGSNQRSFWSVLDKMDIMSPNCVEILHNIRALPDIKTGVGRGRAWIRFALMQKRLSEYFDIFSHSKTQLQEFYGASSLLLDEDTVSMLSGLMVGLNVLEFNFVHRDEDLDNLPTVLDLSPFLKDGNYLERVADNISTMSINSCEDDTDLHQEVMDLTNQNSYLDEVNKKLKNQADEMTAKIVTLETEKMEIGFKLEGSELKLKELASEKDKLLEEKGSREADEKRRLDAAQADIQTERETIQAMNQSLDETNQELKEKLADEITHRLEVEKEVKLQVSMRIEAEEATRLMEKDIHEKQDTLVSLRQQLHDIKAVNLQLYNTAEDRLSELEHKNTVVRELEEKSFRMNDTLKDLQNELKIIEMDKNAAVETARKLGAQLSDKDNAISCLETDVSIEREWRTTLQKEKESLVADVELHKLQLKKIPVIEKERDTLNDRISSLEQQVSEYELSLSDMGMKIREKDELLEEIKEQEERKKSWVDEKSVKSCMHCSADFTNLTRKHHCRNCGNVFCNSCSNHKMKLPSSKDPVRVCIECKSKINASVGTQQSL
ncbi:RUN and FYVE domain-containing protein 2-like isoform X1 [Convolutriloba macropyga]|uniref:RUN and FYVE domain-containing protein 2-like isoform X1 n=1 Tax=Convolutriloba macropyga TaxID=536237 RepID=UPI003F521FFE